MKKLIFPLLWAFCAFCQTPSDNWSTTSFSAITLPVGMTYAIRGFEIPGDGYLYVSSGNGAWRALESDIIAHSGNPTWVEIDTETGFPAKLTGATCPNGGTNYPECLGFSQVMQDAELATNGDLLVGFGNANLGCSVYRRNSSGVWTAAPTWNGGNCQNFVSSVYQWADGKIVAGSRHGEVFTIPNNFSAWSAPPLGNPLSTSYGQASGFLFRMRPLVISGATKLAFSGEFPYGVFTEDFSSGYWNLPGPASCSNVSFPCVPNTPTAYQGNRYGIDSDGNLEVVAITTDSSGGGHNRFRSTDGGTTWSAIADTTIPSVSGGNTNLWQYGNLQRSAYWAQHGYQHVYYMSGGRSPGAGSALLGSLDGGVTWQTVGGVDNGACPTICNFSTNIDPANDFKVYAHVLSGVITLYYHPGVAAAAINPHPRMLFFTSASGLHPNVADLNAKVGSTDWTNLQSTSSGGGFVTTSCLPHSGGIQNTLYMQNYAIAYMANTTNSATYGACAVDLMKFAIAYNYFTGTVTDTFSGNGSTTSFTLSNALYYWCSDCNAGGLTADTVTVVGVAKTAAVQTSCASFSTDACITKGTATITFAVAPASGTSNIVIVHRPDPTSTANLGLWGHLDQSREVGSQILFTFDWTYPLLDSLDKTWIVSWARSVAAWWTMPANFFSAASGFGCGNNEGGGDMIWWQGLVGYATWGDNPTDSGASNNEIALFNKFMDGAITAGTPELRLGDDCLFYFQSGYGKGGYAAEGIEYGSQDMHYLLRTLGSIYTATGTNVLANSLPNLPTAAANFLLHSVSPTTTTLGGNGAQFAPVQFGDEQAGSQWLYTENFRVYALLLQNVLTGTIQQQARWWLDNIQPKAFPFGPGCEYYCFYELLYHTAGWTTSNYQTTVGFPTDLAVPGIQMLISRSDWTANASWVRFYSPPNRLNHLQSANGEIQLWRKGQVLIENQKGWQEVWTVGAVHSVPSVNSPCLICTPVAQSLTTWDGQTNKLFNPNTPVCDNSGGPLCSASDPTFITKFDSNAKYSFGCSDMSNGYQSTGTGGSDGGYGDWHSTTLVYRCMVYLKPDIVFVYDRIGYQAAHNAYAKILWQLPNAPTLNASSIDETVSTQKVRINVLFPASPNIASHQHSAAGGYWDANEHENDGPHGSATCLTTDGGAHCPDDSNDTVSSYRAEVSSGSAVNSESYFHAIEMMDSTATPSAISSLTGLDSNHYGNVVNAATPACAVFSKNGTSYSSVSWTGASFSGTAHCLIANLTPGTGYNVSGPCSLNCTNQTVGSDGTLYVEVSAGAVTISQGCGLGSSPATFGPWTNTQVISATSVTETGCNSSTYTLQMGTSLPTGLSLNSATGAVSGTISASGTFTPTFLYDTASLPMTITVNPVPSITTTTLPSGTVNAAYSQQLSTTGGTGALTCAVSAGSLPTGLSISSGCLISGTPTIGETRSFTVSVQDANGISNTQDLGITVNGLGTSSATSGSLKASGGIVR